MLDQKPSKITLTAEHKLIDQRLEAILEAVESLQHEQQNSTARQRAWRAYWHLIVITIGLAYLLLDASGEYVPIGFLAGCVTIVSVLHGLSMRPRSGRWQLTFYCLVAWIALLGLLEGDPGEIIELVLVVSVFFTAASTVASVLGERLCCGVLAPDEPVDRTRRPSLLSIFGIVTAAAVMLALAGWLSAGGGATYFLGQDTMLTFSFMVAYAGVCSVISVASWAFATRWPGLANACTSMALFFVTQLIVNVGFTFAMYAVRGDWSTFSISADGVSVQVVYCLAQTIPQIAVATVLLATGHMAASFTRRETLLGGPTASVSDFDEL